MPEARPSSVRIRALHEYASLRRTIDELDGVVARLLTEGDQAVGETLAVTAKLFRELSDYIDLQQLFVLPTVRRVDIWGDIRADALASQHEARRDDLGAIERMHRAPIDAAQLASDLRVFAQSLRADLEREERDVLGANGLRDDVVETEAD